jgi:hypothetical protein
MPVFALQAHRRRGAWSLTLPIGVFDNDYRPDACTQAAHVAARERVYAAACAATFAKQRPFRAAYDVLEHDGALYYHPEAMRVYANHVEHPAFLRAAYLFLEAAERNPALIVKPPEKPFVPIEKRAEVFGKTVRGPDWTSEEDAVLRRWFGMRTVGDQAGHHVKLTPEEWARVLVDLPRRNKNSVRNRLVELNRALQREFMRDGFVSRDRLREYMARVLGERPRVPIRPKKSRRRGSAVSLA